MRICQLSTVEHVYNFLAPLCHALREDGHEVVIACNLEHDGREVQRYLGPGFELQRIHGARAIGARALTWDVLELAHYLRHERFDVVHVHGPLVAMQARVAARLAGVPVVISQAHGFYFHAGTRPAARAGLQLLEQAFCRHLTDYLVTVSAEDHALALEHRFRPHPDLVVHVPGVGIDTIRFRPATGQDAAERSRRLREAVATADDAFVVTFVGRLVAEKGLLDLAAAFRQLAVTRPDAVLWLVGDVLASERDRTAPGAVRQVLDAGQVGDRVRFLGRRPDIQAVLQASDAFVLPSHREGMPVSLLEAMACGLPVVVTDIRGCREAVVAEGSGLVVPPHDPASLATALARIVDDELLRRRLAEAARRRVEERYATEHSLAPLLALYRRIALERRATSGTRRPRVAGGPATASTG